MFQDCVLCGDRGKKLKQLIIDKNLNVRKVSFASDEGKDLIHEALFNHGIGSMPFFTDGVKFSTKIQDIYEEKQEKPVEIKKKVKKTTKSKKQKVVEHESD